MFFFFFFKQKTAYEMRISDWSSDVCSSDLPVRALRHGMAGTPGFEMFGPWADGEAVMDALMEAGAKYDIRKVGSLAYPTSAIESGWMQIGRASCRERVCQYV